MKKLEKWYSVMTVIAVFVMLFLSLPVKVYAGDIEPFAPPGPSMHTLEDIYNKIDSLVDVGRVPVRTGQITSLETGDDGDLERGYPWPNPRFTDNGDGTVTDNLTRLVWLKNANCFDAQAWSSALTYSNSLSDGSCGLSDGSAEGDWRLPNVRELHSLVDFETYDPALPVSHPFTNVQSAHSYYWSSTACHANSVSAWYVYMYAGYVYNGLFGDLNYVWPVRSTN